MKILNVTPYCISNYGAMLQAWALRRVLQSMGHEVIYLRYPYFWPGKFGLRRLLCSRSLSALRSKIAVNRQLDCVRREVGGWVETRSYKGPIDLQEDPPAADCYLVGSDQVFHLDYLKSINGSRHSLLNFGADNIPRIAYAASFGRPSWTDEMIASHQWATSLIKRFAYIGLRETTGLDILKTWSGVTGYWTPDPTLLLDSDDYRNQFEIRELGKSRPRVVTYMLGFLNTQQRKALYARVCRCVADCYGTADIVELRPAQSLSYWLTEIANADCVITNSFHGICFSLIFNRQFVPLGFEGGDSWRNERAYNILQHFGLDNKYLVRESHLGCGDVFTSPIGWGPINEMRHEFACVGRSFLMNALKKNCHQG